jgi:hypothetical protein
MPFQRLKFPASNRTAVVGAIPTGTEADEDEAMAPTAVESWREDVIAAAAERTRGGDDRILQRRRRRLAAAAALIPRLKRGFRVLCVG